MPDSIPDPTGPAPAPPAPRSRPITPPSQPRGPGGQFTSTRRPEAAAEQTAPIDTAELRRLLGVEGAPARSSVAWPVVVGVGVVLAILVAGAVLTLVILAGHGLL